MMDWILRGLRWLLTGMVRATFRMLAWIARKLGFARISGSILGCAIGTVFGSSMGVAFGGGAVGGWLVFAPLLAIIGLLIGSIIAMSMRRKPKDLAAEKLTC